MFLNCDEIELVKSLINVPCVPKPSGRRKGQKENKVVYRDVFMSFDIETTQIDEIKQCIMYHWQVALNTDCVILGRDWDSFRQLINIICDCLGENERVMCYVHNLSYEFQWLSGLYHFESSDVFCMDSRKIAKCILNNKIEFRCSYILTNMSLGEFTSKMKVEHKKLDGDDFDYSIKRYPWTELSDTEKQYCINDVLGLNEALIQFMDDDTFYTIPLTSTGYVRREMKQRVRMLCHSYMVGIQPDYDCLKVLQEAFRGGDTHANRFATNSILRDVKSVDRSSSYPDVMINCEFPFTKWCHLSGIQPKEKIESLIEHHYAVLCRVVLRNVTLKNPFWGFPYLPISKCRLGNKPIRPSLCTVDNGRIIKADYLETTITDIDLQILLREYKFKITFVDVWYSRYKSLPDEIKNLIIKYYRNKTELKNVKGMDNFYLKEKAKLNANYGLCVCQSQFEPPMLYHETPPKDDPKQSHFSRDNTKDVKDLVDKFNQRGFIPFSVGVWVTAHARAELHRGLYVVDDQGKKDGGETIPIYIDTDSIKFIGNPDFTKFNNERIRRSKKSGAFATDPKGEIHYMGVFENEPVELKDGTIKQSADFFITQGAKKYCAVYGDELKLTCAGVSKKKGANELKQRANDLYKKALKTNPNAKPDPTHGLSLFRDGFVFKNSSGVEAWFNDDNHEPIDIDGHMVECPKNIYFAMSTYKLGKSGDYEKICESCKGLLLKFIDDIII